MEYETEYKHLLLIKEMHLKMVSSKYPPFSSGHGVLNPANQLLQRSILCQC